ncbi:glycosyltransferase family 9 protein [Mucilaginibacter flavidus]|uniref:glycosyltransferase family 9 protein n=1 Tax=Mucilaginibacter flavidus TaxID=2949309 RepID=UPI00209206D3|nr:hypothetical protein [Mucilaginibacter flavidus]MCO5947675.1 hypothetical protein [Mucilaginibacter flavidus]
MRTRAETLLITLKLIFYYGIPSHILYFGESLGDNLLLTTLSSALVERGYKNIWIKCNQEDIFKYNPSISKVLPFDFLLSIRLLRLFGTKLVSPVYTYYIHEKDQDAIPPKHIVLEMADCLGLTGPIINKPIFNLDPAEEKKGRIFPRQIAIVTSTSGAKIPMLNKEWSIDNYQQVVDSLCESYNFIQLGDPAGAPLKNVLDMRGATTIRESAAILKNSMLLVTHVGFMMHLARAVDCRAVIIYGGREKPWQSGYECFENISSAPPCSPCWLHNKCDFERKCMTVISADLAVKSINIQLRLYGTSLAAEILNN